MRKGGWLFLASVTWLALHAGAVVEPPLPVWSEEEKKASEKEGWIAGGLLLSDDPVEEERENAEPESLVVEAPAADETEEEVPASVIAEKYLAAYFDERPGEFLVDPQGLLATKDHGDRLSFLKYHSGDSTIDLFLYLFDGDQEIPGEVREEEMVERFFSEGKPAAVVCYYLGAPQRSVLYLSPSLTDVVSAAEQRRALQSSIIRAFESAHAPDQLEAFLVQMAIRIYWMERMLSGDSVKAGSPLALSGPVMENRGAGDSGAKSSMVVELMMRWLPHAGVLAGVVLALVCFRYGMIRRARFRFPEFDVEPRLGGAHAAGVGAVISFSNAALPPASQRDQVPDYLRRA